jgi:hypothetical protein
MMAGTSLLDEPRPEAEQFAEAVDREHPNGSGQKEELSCSRSSPGTRAFSRDAIDALARRTPATSGSPLRRLVVEGISMPRRTR